MKIVLVGTYARESSYESRTGNTPFLNLVPQLTGPISPRKVHIFLMNDSPFLYLDIFHIAYDFLKR